MIQTAGDLISFALRASGIIGVGQTAQAEDAFTGLDLLRMLIAQWQKKRWLVFVNQTVGVTSSTGAQTYTIGPGMQFSCARPDRIAAAYLKIIGGSPPNLVDLPLEIIDSYEDFAMINVKSLQTMPAAVFFETGWPTGLLHFWPVPPAGMYGLYVIVKVPLPTYVALTDPLNLPDEYIEALMWAMCLRLQMTYGLPARQDHDLAMRQALNTLRQANLQISQLAIPAPLGRLRPDLSLVGPGLGRAFVLDQGAVLG